MDIISLNKFACVTFSGQQRHTPYNPQYEQSLSTVPFLHCSAFSEPNRHILTIQKRWARDLALCFALHLHGVKTCRDARPTDGDPSISAFVVSTQILGSICRMFYSHLASVRVTWHSSIQEKNEELRFWLRELRMPNMLLQYYQGFKITHPCKLFEILNVLLMRNN
jgi:hypothetical protein